MQTIFTRRQIETTVAALLACVTAIIGIAGRGEARLGPKFLALEKVGRFNEPVYVTQPPGGDLLFVVEKPGTIRIVDRGRVRARPFLDIRDRVKDDGNGGEEGLLSLAFAPDYADSGAFYVAFTDRHDDLRVVEYRRSPGSELLASSGSARDVLTIPEPTTKHHGGLVAFGPDGYLYLGSGDGGPSGDPHDAAQSLDSLRGKLLRIDPRQRGSKPYTVPEDNPFVGRPGRDEIYAYGLRNPWRFSFDRATGALSIGDVGNNRFEEIDYVPAGGGRGANFGWSAFEGFAALKGSVPKGRTVRPILVYPHGPGCSVTGGYVVRDPTLSRIAGREIIGRYVFGDYCSGRIFSFRPLPNKAVKQRKLRFEIPYLTSFGEDAAGRIYVVSQRGPVWRLVARRKRQ